MWSPSVVDDDIEVTPGGKLSLPVANGRERNYHKKWSSDPSFLREWREWGREGRKGR